MKLSLNINHHPIIPIKIDGLPICCSAIIDTGCRDNFIYGNVNDKFWNKTGNIIKSITASGQNIELPEIKQIIQIGKYKFELLFGIGEIKLEESCVILGTKFLRDNEMSLYIKGDNFILKKASTFEIFIF